MAEHPHPAPPARAGAGPDLPAAGRGGEDDATFLAVLGEAVAAVERARLPYAVIGGLASTVLGRPRLTRDIDLFVRAGDARTALGALARAGFAVEETNPQWIYKATKYGVLVDVIFWLKGGIALDDEMIARTRAGTFRGQCLRLIAPEDLILSKAIACDEQSPRHWHDALGIIASRDLDWDYLIRRARLGPRRVLSLLIHAQSNDLPVPNEPIRALFALTYPAEASPPAGGRDDRG